ncbi:MAG: hypothetical protein AB1413_06165 [Thermodesulfobacteriota bacterium]
MTTFDKNMAAAAFAEAGDHKGAREMLGNGAGQKQNKTPEAAPTKPYAKAFVLGAISVSAYVMLFTNEAWVMETFTRGGIYTLFPVLAAFFFSFVHGPFGSDLLSCLGLEARKK